MVVLLSVISLFNTFKLSFNRRKYDLEVFETNLLFFFLLLFTKHSACSARLKLCCLNLMKYCINNKKGNDDREMNGKQKKFIVRQAGFSFPSHIMQCAKVSNLKN